MDYKEQMKRYSELSAAGNEVALELEKSGLSLPEKLSSVLDNWQNLRDKYQGKSEKAEAKLSA